MAKIGFTEKLKKIFGIHVQKNDDFFEELADVLIEGDLGAKTAFDIVDQLQKKCHELKLTEEKDIISELKKMLLDFVKTIELSPDPCKTNVFLVLGVNGVGKTTSVAKMAGFFESSGKYNVVMAAADTFRAAAIDQLIIHGERLGIRVVSHQDGADPGAVVFDAADAVSAKGGGIVLADTAGRLHNKENLVRELQKIDRIATTKASPNCYKKLLVIDATTGQNALRQAEVFNDAVGVDAVILTKYDSTARGGVAASIGRELNIPVAFVCNGEGYENIMPFSPEKYVDDFLGLQKN